MGVAQRRIHAESRLRHINDAAYRVMTNYNEWQRAEQSWYTGWDFYFNKCRSIHSPDED